MKNVLGSLFGPLIAGAMEKEWSFTIIGAFLIVNGFFLAFIEYIVKRFPLGKGKYQIDDLMLKPIKAGLEALPTANIFGFERDDEVVVKRDIRTEFSRKCEERKKRKAFVNSSLIPF